MTLTEEVFDDEIALGEDLYDLLTGRPVHTDATELAHHAVAIASTVIPAGKLLKAAKLTGKAVKTAAKAGVVRSEVNRESAREAKAVAKAARKSYSQTKHSANLVKGANNAIYVAIADQENAKSLERNLRSIAKNAPAVYADYLAMQSTAGSLSAAKKVITMAKKGFNAKKALKVIAANPSVRRAATGAAKQATKSLKKTRNKPMTKEDLQVVGQNAMYGALNGLLTKPRKKILSNHPAWYTKLGTDLVNLNFGAPDGVGPRPTVFKQGGKTLLLTTDAIAEVMLTVPSTGANALSVAAARIGNELRLHSGSNTIYTPIDIQAYLIEGRSFMAELCTWRRILKSLNYVDPYDVDMPDKLSLMCMMGTTSARAAQLRELKSFAASILTRINAITKTLGALIPINIPLMQRTEWMFSSVFVDGKEAKNSMKIFAAGTVPTAYINASGDIEVSMREILPEFATSMKWYDCLQQFEGRVAKFVSDRVNMAIAGDMMKAYGSGAFWSPGVLKGDESITPVYDEEALCQIQNATPTLIYPMQDGGVLPYMQLITNTGELSNHFPLNATAVTAYQQEHTPAAFATKILTTFKPKPSPGDVLEMTRLTALADIKLQATDPVGSPNWEVGYITDIVCGTEVMINYHYIYSKTNTLYGFSLDAIDAVYGLQTDLPLVISCWSMDDWAPAVFIGTSTVNNPDGSSATVIDQILDLSNWAKCDKTNLDSFHFIASNSLLVVDSMVTPVE